MLWHKAMNLRNSENISILQTMLKEFSLLIDEFSIIQINKRNKLKPLQIVSNNLLNRTQINREALILLLENYKLKRSAILPIGLLIRSILSDFITFCYLSSFSDKNDVDEISIQNELKLLERDYLMAMIEVGEIEGNIHQYNKNIPTKFKNREAYELALNDVKELYKHLYKGENPQNDLKEPKELRATSFTEFFDSKEEFEKPHNFITEKYKWKRMIKRGFSKYVIVFTAFKFFSQFQHYSPDSAILTREITEPHAFFHLLMAFDSMIIVTHMQFQVIDGKESKYLPRLREIEKTLDNIIGKD